MRKKDRQNPQDPTEISNLILQQGISVALNNYDIHVMIGAFAVEDAPPVAQNENSAIPSRRLQQLVMNVDEKRIKSLETAQNFHALNKHAESAQFKFSDLFEHVTRYGVSLDKNAPDYFPGTPATRAFYQKGTTHMQQINEQIAKQTQNLRVSAYDDFRDGVVAMFNTPTQSRKLHDRFTL